MNAHAERKRLRLAIAPGITVPEATGLSERYRLVNDGKADQSDYSVIATLSASILWRAWPSAS